MSVVTGYSHGEFCWTELAVQDVPAAKIFYQGLFGWKFRDVPIGGGQTYSMCLVDDKEVCAMYTMCEEVREMKVPPSWLAYIHVDNVDDCVGRIKTIGGKVLAEPMDVMDAGRLAMIQDPTGAKFGIWQARKHIGAALDESPGTVCWRELITPNLDAAGKFYSTLFGWRGKVEDMGGMKYHMYMKDDEGRCGMLSPPAKDMHPNWMTHWVVENCEKSVAKAKQLGAFVCRDTTEIPNVGRFAILGDSQGAGFGIFESQG